VAYLGFRRKGPWRACGAQAYNKGLAAEPPEAETLQAYGRSMEAANFRTCLKFRNTETTDICVVLPKEGHRTMALPLNTPLTANTIKSLKKRRV